MKKYIKILLLLTILLCIKNSSFAKTLNGEIEGASSNKILIANSNETKEILLNEQGNFTIENADDEFTIFVPVMGQYEFYGDGWKLSENKEYVWITVGKDDENIPSLKFANNGYGKIAVSAFQDDNMNGIRGKYEELIEGISVDLLDKNGNNIASLETDSDEKYFEKVPVGEYYLVFNCGQKYFFTGLGDGRINYQNSITDRSFDLSSSTQVFKVEADTTVHATSALYFASSMSGRVWLDQNNNGIMDENEAHFTDVEISAHSKTNGENYTANIDENGNWNISRIPNGEYELKAELPDGYLFALYSLEGRELRSIFTEYTNNYDTRIYKIAKAQDLNNLNIGVVKTANVSITTFLDENYNGVYDTGEPPVEGVKVEIIRDKIDKILAKGTSDANGHIDLYNLRENEYRIHAVISNQNQEFTKLGDSSIDLSNYFEKTNNRMDSNINDVMLSSDKQNNIVVGIAEMIDIGGKTYIDSNVNGQYDAGEKLVADIEINAYNEKNELISSTKSNAKGEYRLMGLYYGKVKLEFIAKKDYMFVRNIYDNNFLNTTKENKAYTDYFDLVMGDSYVDIDAGIIPHTKIDGRVFEDLNDNGIDDDSCGFAGMNVELLDTNGNTLISTLTNEDGYYVFDGIIPGKYFIKYTVSNTEEIVDSEDKTSFTSEQINFQIGENLEMKTIGALHLASLNVQVFVDKNANGVYDKDEKLGSAKIHISSDNKKQEDIKENINKNVSIENIRPGRLKLDIELPSELIFSKNKYGIAGNKDTIKIDQKTLLEDKTINISCIKPSTIKTSAWLDEDMNNSKSSVDKPYKNAKFMLINEEGKQKEFRADDEGNIKIDNVVAGKYKLGLILNSASKAMPDLKVTSVSGKKIAYRDFIINSDESINVDEYGVQELMSISGKLLLDVNNEFKPISSQNIRLFCKDKLIAQTQSDEQGNYDFQNLIPGTYQIVIDSLSNAVFIEPDDSKYANNNIAAIKDNMAYSKKFDISMPDSLQNIDFIAILPATIGDFAWVDTNNNSLQDMGEPAVANVLVDLIKDDSVKYSTKTDGNGFYIFENVYPGEYTLRVSLREEFDITGVDKNIPEISSVLTRKEKDKAYSDKFTINSGDIKFNFDFGFKLKDGYQLDENLNSPTTQDWSRQTEQTNQGWSR